MITVAADFKLLFFDRQKIEDPAEKAALKQQSRFGAFVMTGARRSIKYKNGPSRPGNPPHAHTVYESKTKRTKTGKAKKDYPFRSSILFGYDAANKRTVVGPVFRRDSRTNPTVPESLEHGGTFSVGGRTKKRRTVRIAARPFMVPALERERPKFAAMFRDSITR